MRFEYFDHTADTKFRAYGKTLEERFANAGVAMMHVMFNTEEVGDNLSHAITAEGSDLKQLMYNYLEEILYLMDTQNFILKNVEEVKISKTKEGFKLSCVLMGSDWKESYEQHGHVKAATYAEMEFTPEYVQVVVDI